MLLRNTTKIEVFNLGIMISMFQQIVESLCTSNTPDEGCINLATKKGTEVLFCFCLVSPFTDPRTSSIVCQLLRIQASALPIEAFV